MEARFEPLCPRGLRWRVVTFGKEAVVAPSPPITLVGPRACSVVDSVAV